MPETKPSKSTEIPDTPSPASEPTAVPKLDLIRDEAERLLADLGDLGKAEARELAQLAARKTEQLLRDVRPEKFAEIARELDLQLRSEALIRSLRIRHEARERLLAGLVSVIRIGVRVLAAV